MKRMWLGICVGADAKPFSFNVIVWINLKGKLNLMLKAVIVRLIFFSLFKKDASFVNMSIKLKTTLAQQ